MIDPVAGQIALGVYAALLAAGGIIGFVKARSKASLIAGLLSAVLALVALALSAKGSGLGIPLGLLVAVALLVLFGYRYARGGRKFMPSGLLAVVSLVVLGVLLLVII
jgi:uncharacterized membrane protein (UPF0136 family)